MTHHPGMLDNNLQLYRQITQSTRLPTPRAATPQKPKDPTPPPTPPPKPMTPKPATPKPPTPEPIRVPSPEVIKEEVQPESQKPKKKKKKIPVKDPELPVVETPPKPDTPPPPPRTPTPPHVVIEAEQVKPASPIPKPKAPEPIPKRKLRKSMPQTPIKTQDHDKKAPDVEFKLPFQFDTNVTGNALLDWLSQFCILSDAKKAQFGKVFTFFDAAKANYLTPIEVRESISIYLAMHGVF